jgi:hydroxyacylglutathione hydrolase
MSYRILAVPALNDNYIWAIVHPRKKSVVIVDPGEAKPILNLLKQQKLNLAGILITHHHWDHTNGIEGILKVHPTPVFAPAKDDVIRCDHPVEDGDQVVIPEMELTFDVIDIPGHTLGHVAYLGHGWVFTGDTLFTGGCGRIFEGTPDQLYSSLSLLAKLDPKTEVYCGHEYTKKNLAFAAMIEPFNNKLEQRIDHTEGLLNKGLPTVPSTIELELQTNPFLRCHEHHVQQAAIAYCGQPLADNVAVFAALRRWKDEF